MLKALVFERNDLPRPSERVDGENEDEGDDLGFLQPLIGTLVTEFERLAKDVVGPHRVLNPEGVCRINELSVRPLTPDGERALAHVLKYFNKARIVGFLQRKVLARVVLAPYFDFTKFKGIKCPAVVDQPAAELQDDVERQAMLDVIREIGLDQRSDQFVIRIDFAFVEAAVPAAEWLLSDAEPARRLKLDRVSPDRPLKIGRRPDMDIPLKATGRTLASGHHGNLWFDQGAWWYQDAGSRNGSRIECQGQVDTLPLSGAPSQPVRLGPGSTIVFCAVDGGAAETPETHPRLCWDDDRQAVPRTPLAEGRNQETPETPVSEGTNNNGRPGYRIHLSGVTEQEIHLTSFPATVGTESQHDVRVPAAHTSVSRHHLTLHSMNDEGVEIEVIGRNGVSRRGKTEHQGARLRLAWGETIGLGYPVKGEPVCTLTLLRP
jgi:hypothetical protein